MVLSDINGNPYGIFGQPNQWHLDVDLAKLREEEQQQLNENQYVDESEEDSGLFEEESQPSLPANSNVPTMTDEEMLTRRSNVWESTSIGMKFSLKSFV